MSKHVFMPFYMKKELCEYAECNPKSSQKSLVKWVEEKFKLRVNQSTISLTLKAKERYLGTAPLNKNAKKTIKVNYPEVEERLLSWLVKTQEQTTVRAEHMQEKARQLFTQCYPDAPQDINFSNGWVRMDD